MHEGWLRKDPSTVLDEDFAIAASDGCVCVCVSCYEALSSQGTSRRLRGNGSGGLLTSWTEEPLRIETKQLLFFFLLPIFFFCLTKPSQQRAVLYQTAAGRGGQQQSKCFNSSKGVMDTTFGFYDTLFLLKGGARQQFEGNRNLKKNKQTKKHPQNV